MTQSPKKILYLQSVSEIGGSDMTLLRTVEVLDKTRFEPHVVLPGAGPLIGAFRDAGCKIHILPSMRKLTSRNGGRYFARYMLGYLPAIFQIVRLIRFEGISLVHTNSLHNLYGFLAAKLAGVPHIWHVREIVAYPRFMKRLETALARHFSVRCIVMSDAIANMFQSTGKSPAPPLVKLYDGIDLDLFHPNQRSGLRIRKELGIGEGVPFIGNVNRLDPKKGLVLFLEAAAEIHKDMPEARFLICGGEIPGHEGYELILKERAKALGIADWVFFSGWRYCFRDIPEIYGALDVSVQCPVYPEAYGLANIEAMATGVPVVAVAEGGPAEICVHGESALLIPSHDPRAIARTVIALLKDPVRAGTIGAAGRRRAEDLFDRRKCTKALEKLYGEVLKEGS